MEISPGIKKISFHETWNEVFFMILRKFMTYIDVRSIMLFSAEEKGVAYVGYDHLKRHCKRS